MAYQAPIAEIKFVLETIARFSLVRGAQPGSDLSEETTEAVLTEAGRLCEEQIAPLQRSGDMQGAVLKNGRVRSPDGFAEAYSSLVEGGWIGISADESFGGMGLPHAYQVGVHEMMAGACLSFEVQPLLSQSAIDAIQAHASEAIRQTYLPKLVSGVWSGTMNLTEPQAGSDVGALRTKAEPQGNGTYKITGQKIYISWGDCDFTENVCHLVLARTPGAPEGTRGISLFLVPRQIPDADGRAGVANDLRVQSLEHKLGLHASPTCVMQYEGATGWLIGEENAGLAAMFTMMNRARLGVAVQGIGTAEAAYQQATHYAMDRVQGKTRGPTGSIVDHADVRRMLAEMRAEIHAARGIALSCAVAIDLEAQPGWEARAALLTPIAKAFGTDIGVDVASLGIQVHGGMGFVEETGAAQYLRDARVLTIYEGTNGIQAMDLVTRKMSDGGEEAFKLIDEIEQAAEDARAALPDLANALWSAAEGLREATETIVARSVSDRLPASAAYLRAFARVLGGHVHLLSAIAEGGEGPRTRLARFYMARLLPESGGLFAQVAADPSSVLDVTPDDLAA
ncbi:MAG: acyl-CoA dehydrogenase [Pseudomonadota bacterium]